MLLVIDPDMEGVLEYRGGVLIFESGVAGAELGGSPRSFLCAGVRGMSSRSSSFRNRGSSANTMLTTGISWNASHIQPAYRALKCSPILQVRRVSDCPRSYLRTADLHSGQPGNPSPNRPYDQHECQGTEVVDDSLDVRFGEDSCTLSLCDLGQARMFPVARALRGCFRSVRRARRGLFDRCGD